MLARLRSIPIWFMVVAPVGLVAGGAASLLVFEPFPIVPAGHVAILVCKEGRTSPPGAIIAPVPDAEGPYQGVQLDVLGPGWYPRYHAYHWDWLEVRLATVPAGHVGVLVRRYGADLAAGQILADEDTSDPVARKGVLAETLEPGSYPINPLAYDMVLVPRIEIESGQVGIVTRQTGPLPTDPDALLSEPGERGVQKTTLPPGSHYVNPFFQRVTPISHQSQRTDLAAQGRRVKFPTRDGFEIQLNGTVEWSLGDESVPLVFCKFGDIEDTERKLLLPATRAISRIHGTRKPAREFITGTTRGSFQGEFQADLRRVVEAEGPKIHAVLISELIPPREIADPIQEREKSLRVRDQFEAEIIAEAHRAELVAQKEAAVGRPPKHAIARTKNVTLLEEARADREKRLIEARSKLVQTRFDLDAARRQSDAKISEGTATAEAKRRTRLADVGALALRIEASGGGEVFARTALYERIAPRFQSILANTDGPLAAIFEQFSAEGTVPRRVVAKEDER